MKRGSKNSGKSVAGRGVNSSKRAAGTRCPGKKRLTPRSPKHAPKGLNFSSRNSSRTGKSFIVLSQMQRGRSRYVSPDEAGAAGLGDRSTPSGPAEAVATDRRKGPQTFQRDPRMIISVQNPSEPHSELLLDRTSNPSGITTFPTAPECEEGGHSPRVLRSGLSPFENAARSAPRRASWSPIGAPAVGVKACRG